MPRKFIVFRTTKKADGTITSVKCLETVVQGRFNLSYSFYYLTSRLPFFAAEKKCCFDNFWRKNERITPVNNEFKSFLQVKLEIYDSVRKSEIFKFEILGNILDEICKRPKVFVFQIFCWLHFIQIKECFDKRRNWKSVTRKLHAIDLFIFFLLNYYFIFILYQHSFLNHLIDHISWSFNFFST